MSKEIELKPIEEWQEYKIGELFKIRRGKRIVKEDYQEDNKKYKVITAKTNENGVDGTYDEYNAEENILTVCGEVSGMKTFYQKEKTWVLDTVRICEPLFELNRYIAMFLIPIFEKNMNRYGFGKKLRPEHLNNTIIKLPSKDGKPDWEYMEEYIKYLEEKHLPSLEEIKKSKSNKKIELKPIEEWQEYKIGELFKIRRGKRIVKEDYQEDNKKYKVITAKTNENGVDGTYDEYNAEENILTVCGEVSGMKTFYQKEKTWVLDTVRICEPLFELNRYIAMFLIPIFEKNMNRYGFGKKLRPEHLNNTIIKLPSKDGKPDWEYMEEYIKSLPYSNKI